MTRRRAFWPGQSGQSIPPGFLGRDDGERRREPAVRWRAVDHPLYPDDVEHGPAPAPAGEPEPDEPEPVELDDFARYDRYGRFDDHYLFADEDEDDGLDRYEIAAPDRYADPYDADSYDAEPYGDEWAGAGLYRFDDLAPPEGVHGAGLRDGRGRGDAGAVLRAMLVDRDGYRVAPRRRRRKARGRWRLALAERLVAAWPGQSDQGAPPGFPNSGELVLHPAPRMSADSTLVRLPLPGDPAGDAAGHLDGGGPVVDDANAEVRTGGAGRAQRGRRDRSSPSVPGLPSPRSLQRVALAVYAALADPIVNADPEARERRTLQVRRFGLLAGSAALAVVLIYAIFPVRTYLEQRSATQRARERIDKLSEANAELEQRKEDLRDEETVEEIARRDYQLVFPGEESYGLLPPPVAPTTTTTPPGG